MLDLAWKVFCKTGSVDAYLLMKELENESVSDEEDSFTEGQHPLDYPQA